MPVPTTSEASPQAPLHQPLPRGADSHRATGSVLRFAIWGLNLGPLLFLVLMLLVMALTVPYFATARNVTNLLQQSSTISMLAMGQLVVILARGVDISSAAQVGFSSVAGALLFTHHHSPAMVVLLAMVGMTACIGLLNGLVLIYGRMPHPFIVTIGSYSILRGLAYVMAPFPVEGVPGAFDKLGSTTVLGFIPLTAVSVAVVALLLTLLLRRSQWGLWVYAVGGNPEAARRTGIPLNRVLISTYVVSGVCAGIAGVLTMGITATGDPSAATDALLDAIVAVVIGGASFLGGRGTIVNALVGALIIGTIRNGMDLLGINSFYQLVVLGVVLLFAVAVDAQRGQLIARLRVHRALDIEHHHG